MINETRVTELRLNAEAALKDLIEKLKSLEQTHQSLVAEVQKVLDGKQHLQNLIISTQASLSSLRLVMGEDPLPNTLVDEITKSKPA